MDLIFSAEAIGLYAGLGATIVQFIKAGGVPSKFTPFVSLVVGVALAFLGSNAAAPIGATVITGLVIALTASGAYSAGKAVVKK